MDDDEYIVHTHKKDEDSTANRKKEKSKKIAQRLAWFGPITYLYTYEDDKGKFLFHMMLHAILIIFFLSIMVLAIFVNVYSVILILLILLVSLFANYFTILQDIYRRSEDYYTQYYNVENGYKVDKKGNKNNIEGMELNKYKKNKKTALKLAIFSGHGVYLYTYEDDLKKFLFTGLLKIGIMVIAYIVSLSGLVLNLIFSRYYIDWILGGLSGLFLLLIIFSFINGYILYDISTRPSDYYENYC